VKAKCGVNEKNMRSSRLLLILQLADVYSVRYLLVRHGETNHNANGIIQGSSDFSRLTPKGQAQARAAGLGLAALDDVSVSRVFVSPLARARQTLELLSPPMQLPKACEVDALREIDLHSWECRQKEDLKMADPLQYANWKGDALAFTLDGHRPVVDLWDRAREEAWVQMRAGEGDESDGTLTLVVCHNACAQALLCTSLGLGAEHFRSFTFANAAVAEVDWPTGEDRAVRWRWRLPAETEWNAPGDA
jgi:broad specificity phosphatase PhoE